MKLAYIINTVDFILYSGRVSILFMIISYVADNDDSFKCGLDIGFVYDKSDWENERTSSDDWGLCGVILVRLDKWVNCW